MLLQVRTAAADSDAGCAETASPTDGWTGASRPGEVWSKVGVGGGGGSREVWWWWVEPRGDWAGRWTGR